MIRTQTFDGLFRRLRPPGVAAAIVAAMALGAAISQGAGIAGWAVWLLPAGAAIVAGGLIRHGGRGPPRHAQQFGGLRIHIRWSGQDCVIDAGDALHAMRVKAEEAMLRRLAVRYGDDRLFQDENGRWWFCETALLDWLHRKAGEGDPRAPGFHRWLAREALPAMRRRGGPSPP